MRIVVDHVAGSRCGQRQEFSGQMPVRFGRHPDNEVSFDAHRDLDASSWHAELRAAPSATAPAAGAGFGPSGFVLRDVGSSNGLVVDGAVVTEVELPVGRSVEVAFGSQGPRVRIFIRAPGEAAAVPTPFPVQPAQTLQMMLRTASAHANKSGGVRRGTAFIQSVVDQALHHSTRRFKIALSLVVTALVGAVALVVIGLLGRVSDRERIASLEREQEEREQRWDQTRTEGAGPRIAATYGPAIFSLVSEGEGGAFGFCTGFAVAPGWLATNAHCSVELSRRVEQGHRVYAVQNGGDGARIAIRGARADSRYGGGLSVDVGLVQIAGEIGAEIGDRVELADRADLERLRKGANVFTLGFPGRLAMALPEGTAPDATIVDGIVGRITNFDGQRDSFANELLVQHNLLTSPGTSGSPIFDGFGKVVAINAGAYTEASTDVLVDPATGQRQTVRRDVLTPGANYAIRIDALGELLRDNGLPEPGWHRD